MRRMIYAAALAVMVAGCNPLGGVASVPASPGALADTTVMDERAAIAVESAYAAFGQSLEIAVDTGALRGPAAARAAELDRKAYAAVRAARAAYDAGNAAGYADALAGAREAIAAALVAINGD